MNQGMGIKRQEVTIHCNNRPADKSRQTAEDAMVLSFCLFSSIRTVTVGPGVSPDLLTFAKKSCKALAGSPGI